ncbi:hypothetical protein [Actinoplanes sp. G11-F43]|uniref:hypothetical protein n=1 Tax=Actinoplanes sp. G11-F43 TaxID=3424130 RepID=UPI003D33D9FE
MTRRGLLSAGPAPLIRPPPTGPYPLGTVSPHLAGRDTMAGARHRPRPAPAVIR